MVVFNGRGVALLQQNELSIYFAILIIYRPQEMVTIIKPAGVAVSLVLVSILHNLTHAPRTILQFTQQRAYVSAPAKPRGRQNKSHKTRQITTSPCTKLASAYHGQPEHGSNCACGN